MNKQILLAVLLSAITIIATVAIIFSPTAIGRFILDYSAVAAGLFLTVEGSISIYINRKQAFGYHITRIFRITLGLAMICIHALRILPVPTREILSELI